MAKNANKDRDDNSDSSNYTAAATEDNYNHHDGKRIVIRAMRCSHI